MGFFQIEQDGIPVSEHIPGDCVMDINGFHAVTPDGIEDLELIFQP
jgi:hypothetical protein